MSMLAERKRKHKWSLNPRGKAWSSDANKFGQKMLEKMGWQPGKGLGANESGITEHVKVSYKHDTQGMGYKDFGEEWTEHGSNFSALLESLSGGIIKPKEIKVNSLEKKSQISRARVHYHKFTRGKDLSLYSEKDLANIFGRKNLDDIGKVNAAENDNQEEVITEVNQTSFLLNRGSMKDYFNKKLTNSSNINTYKNNAIKRDDSESDEAKPGFGFKSEEHEDNGKIEKDKRKADFCDNIFSPRKKLKKEKLTNHDVYSFSNPSFNLIDSPIEVKKHTLNTINESFQEYISENNECDSSVNNSDMVNLKENEEKGPKNMEIRDDLIKNHGSSEDDLTKKLPRKKKYKKYSKIVEGISNPVFESKLENNTENSEIQGAVDNFEKKIKKTKNKNLEKYEGISSPVFKDKTIDISFNENSEVISSIENPYEVKLEKKVKKKGLKGSNVDLCDNINEEENNTYKSQSGLKIKKKHKSSKCGVINPTFNDLEKDTSEGMSCQNMNGHIKKKKSKKNKTDIVDFQVEYGTFQEKQDHEPFLETESGFEIHVKKKNKRKYIENASLHTLDYNTDVKKYTISNNQSDLFNIDDCNLMLNVVSTPDHNESVKSQQVTNMEVDQNIKRRKSVRFSDITEEHIIPNNEELKMMENDFEAGIDNVNFNSIQSQVDENLETISNTLDMYQAEIENDINEMKQTTLEDLMVGEVGNSHGENEKVQDGTKLKYKYADFDSRTPVYQLNKTGAKKSYKHLIKGDIIVKFNNTNLHEIKGYACVKRKN